MPPKSCPLSMVKLSPRALGIGYDYVLLVIFFETPCSFRVDNVCQNFHHQNFVAELYRLTEGSERQVQAGNSFPWLHKYRGQETG